jgi:sterol 24-C-methyltransferase
MSPKTPTEANRKLADGRQLDRITNYAKHWQKDLKTNTEVRYYSFLLLFLRHGLTEVLKADMENRIADYDNVVNGYYDGATELYEWGWGTSFHFSRFYKGEGFTQSVSTKNT